MFIKRESLMRADESLKHRLRYSGVMFACGMLMLFVATFNEAAGQSPESTTLSQPPPALPTQTADTTVSLVNDRYHIGPGDVLDIRVFNRPQLSRDGVRVDGRGMIRMPLLPEEVQAACRTESVLAQEITRLYLKYQRNPHVDVFVKEFNSHPAAIVGAVTSPGRFQLQRRVRLLEMLALAGGPTERVGGRIQIVRAAEFSMCDARAPDPASGETASGLLSFNLNDTLRGVDVANPFIRPGDIISVPEAEQAFVVGNVLRPAVIPLREPITVSRAIAMAGGTMPDTKKNRIRIIRQATGSAQSTELFVDLDAISRRKADDVTLLAGDIVEVPTSSGKRILRSLIGAVIPAVSQLPVQVIR